jgi:hypothetical protein
MRFGVFTMIPMRRSICPGPGSLMAPFLIIYAQAFTLYPNDNKYIEAILLQGKDSLWEQGTLLCHPVI